MSINTKEQRSAANLPTLTSGRNVSGYAALFNVRSQNLGTATAPWFEVVMPGSLPDLTKQDCRALLNHEPSKILARSKFGKGTLSLSIDSRGLKYSFVAPNSTVGNDLIESLARKDIDQSSFSFIVEKDNWITEGNVRIRQIVKIKSLLDISPVVYPAYAEATSQVRSKQTAKPDFAAIHKRRLNLLK
jgi:uncharacterized protein